MILSTLRWWRPPGQPRAKKYLHDGNGFVLAPYFAVQGDHVGASVLAGPARRERIIRQRRANSLHVIRRDRDSDSRGADDHAERTVARSHSPRLADIF